MGFGFGSAVGLGSGRISRRDTDGWDCIRVSSQIESGSVIGGERKRDRSTGRERAFGGRCDDSWSVKVRGAFRQCERAANGEGEREVGEVPLMTPRRWSGVRSGEVNQEGAGRVRVRGDVGGGGEGVTSWIEFGANDGRRRGKFRGAWEGSDRAGVESEWQGGVGVDGNRIGGKGGQHAGEGKRNFGEELRRS